MVSNDESAPLFNPPRSISNLARPDIETFLDYSRVFFDARRYTNAGPLSIELESRLAAFHGVARCVTFSNGFWALVLAIRACALPGRSEVVLPSLTYRRMADIVAWAGLVPRYCDVDAATLAVSAETVSRCLDQSTALVLGVHPIVNCAPAAQLEAVAIEAGVPLIFDAVESCYETYAGRKIGSFGRAEVFSIGATKLINGFEGGYLTTDDAELADQLYFARGFGFIGHDNVAMLGTNAKLNEIHAAMALASLDGLESQVLRNRDRYVRYRQKLRHVPGISLVAFDETQACSYKSILVELDDSWPLTRDATVDLLQRRGALARPYYSPALHHQGPPGSPAQDPLPTTEYLEDRLLLLPCGEKVTLEDVDAIADLLASVSTSRRLLGAGASR
jgi:dTDP-4-amino-4,6-dideoxygalactose transaminase